MIRKTKQISAEDLQQSLTDLVNSGSMLAIGGTTIHMNPMGLLRMLIRAAHNHTSTPDSVAISSLDLVAGPLAGPGVDLMCGAGMVARVRAAYVAAEYLGLCPNFMRTVVSGDVEMWECGETIFLQGLQAAAEGRAFGSTMEGLGTDLLTLNRDLRQFEDPITQSAMVAVPPIAPDLCFLHVPKADIFGNACHQGPIFSDFILASATKKNGGIVIVSTEEITKPAERGCLEDETSRVTLPASLVDYVVELNEGAYPTACHGKYPYDEDAIRLYLSQGKSEASFKTWLQQEVLTEKGPNPAEKSQRPEKGHITPSAAETAYSSAELLAVRLSECIRDGEFGSAGANSPIPQAAMRLAQLTHSPNMNYISSYSGYLCRFRSADQKGEQPGTAENLAELRERLYWSSFDYRNLAAAECALDSPEIFRLKRDFFFVGGLQFDRCGNINLIGIGKSGAMKIRGPGSAGIGLVSATATRLFLYSAIHDKRTIVNQVDFISGMGHPESRNKRKKLGLPGAGPALLITPLCNFDFNEKGLIRLKSLNPGVTVDAVLERTGVEVDIPASGVPEAPAPNREQLKILRHLIDPGDILKEIKTTQL